MSGIIGTLGHTGDLRLVWLSGRDEMSLIYHLSDGRLWCSPWKHTDFTAGDSHWGLNSVGLGVSRGEIQGIALGLGPTDSYEELLRAWPRGEGF